MGGKSLLTTVGVGAAAAEETIPHNASAETVLRRHAATLASLCRYI